MNLKLRIGALKAAIKRGKIKPSAYVEGVLKWKSDDEAVPLDLNHTEDPLLKVLKAELTLTAPTDPEAATGLRQLEIFARIKDNPAGERIGKLETFAQALKSYLEKYAVGRMVCRNEEDGTRLLYVVETVVYSPAEPRHDIPATVALTAAFIKFGQRERYNETWRTYHVRGKNVADILREDGLSIVTAEILADYEKEFERFQAIRGEVGEQYTSEGLALVEGQWGNKQWRTLAKDGTPSKLVIDESKGGETVSGVIPKKNWSVKTDDDEDSTDTEEVLTVPVHPYVKVFDLGAHYEAYLHAGRLQRYEYDPECFRKLILPEEVKDLLQVLIQGTGDLEEDIVRGKTGGINILSTGEPGTGKTLTAEVYSEMLKRPLYSVHASQLGITPEDLEKELRTVLSRAVKWKAILLIDEADVYIHKRGGNIEQNAIVGVILRVLEYYRGVLFMTSNRGEVIDDAVMSRCVAHIQYAKPGPLLREVWEMLAEQFKVEMADSEVISLAVAEWPDASGRDVKNFLKLAKLLAKRDGVPVTFERLKFVHRFKT